MPLRTSQTNSPSRNHFRNPRRLSYDVLNNIFSCPPCQIPFILQESCNSTVLCCRCCPVPSFLSFLPSVRPAQALSPTLSTSKPAAVSNRAGFTSRSFKGWTAEALARLRCPRGFASRLGVTMGELAGRSPLKAAQKERLLYRAGIGNKTRRQQILSPGLRLCVGRRGK